MFYSDIVKSGRCAALISFILHIDSKAHTKAWIKIYTPTWKELRLFLKARNKEMTEIQKYNLFN